MNLFCEIILFYEWLYDYRMDDDSDEELHEEYINQVMRDETDFNELVLTIAATIVQHHNTFLVKEPCRDSSHTGMKFVMEILNGNDRRCQEMFRMEKHVFCKLCDRLRSYGMCSSKGVQLEEAVCMFLMTLGHGVGNRMIQERFQRSGETVSRQFGIVLQKMINLALQEIRPLDNYDEVPLYIRSNPKYWPYFKVI